MDPIAQAKILLQEGRLVAFPTETVYGLGARADRDVAVARIFEAKQRPSFDPLIAHFPDTASVRGWAQLDARAEHLAERFWPGPLTMILKRIHRHGTPRIPDIVTSGLDTVGVRVPDQPLARQLLSGLDFPVAAPSANRFGYVSPTTAQHVRDGLGDRVDLVLDGGPCRVGLESTIVDLTSPVARLLRPGGLPREALEAALDQSLPWDGFRPPVATEAPGMLETHYSPNVGVEVFEDQTDLVRRAQALGGHCVVVSQSLIEAPCQEAIELGDGAAMAAALFSTLRRLDREETGKILALLPAAEGIGLAVRDRLFRSARSRFGGG